jgi:hypothetical protein
MAFGKVSSSSSSLESSSSSLDTYLGGEDFDFTFFLLSFATRQVYFPLLRLGKIDLLEEEEGPLIVFLVALFLLIHMDN